MHRVLKSIQSEQLSPSDSNILLKPLQISDFEGLYRVASDPEIWAQHPDSTRSEHGGFRNFFEQAFQPDHAPYLVLHGETQEIMGSSRYYLKNGNESELFIGYTFLARKFWGGYWNRCLKSAMLEHAFRFCKTVYFEAAATNARSIAALSKLGADQLIHPEENKVLFCIREGRTRRIE